MLYRGSRENAYLYEVTASDVLLPGNVAGAYRAGNIVIFASKHEVSLGAEIARAESYDAALEFLANDNLHGPEPWAQEAELGSCAEQLRELQADLDSQRSSNQVLLSQIEALREQLTLASVTRSEIADDLETASAEIWRKDQELAETVRAKESLERELAARIVELMELEAAKKLADPRPEGARTPAAPAAPVATRQPSPQLKSDEVRVLHEFRLPQKPRSSPVSSLMRWARFVGLIAVVLLIFVAGSVLATALLNGVSLVEAFTLLLKAVLPT